MWYAFPQYDGLGFSPTSLHYTIKSPAGATAKYPFFQNQSLGIACMLKTVQTLPEGLLF
jgi:uncharacterized protein (DUF1810 family)